MPRICCVPISAPGPVSGRMAPILIVSARAAAIVNAQPNSAVSTKRRMDRFSRFSRAGLGVALMRVKAMRVKAVAGFAPRRYFLARITHLIWGPGIHEQARRRDRFRNPAGAAQAGDGARTLDRGFQSGWRILWLVQSLPASG